MAYMEIQKEKDRTIIQERYLAMGIWKIWKIGKQLLIPVTIILILGLYLGINSTGKMNYKIPAFDAIDGEEITIIEIEGLSGSLKLYSDNGIWKLDTDDLRAEPSKVAEMISFLVDPEFIDMVSDTGNYQNYGLVDGEYITVRAWTNNNNEGNPDRELFIGNINTTGSFTFIRRPDNASVFTVSGNKRTFFDITRNDLLDKRILNIEIPEIDKIVLSFSESTYILEKTVGDNNVDIWTTSKGLSIENNNLEQNLRYLSSSRFNSYIDNIEVVTPDSLFKIELLGENLDDSFIISEKNDTGYFCESSFAGKSFIISENTGTQIIKMFNELTRISHK